MADKTNAEKWFSEKRALDEMKIYTEKGFKQWEKAVVSKYFKPKAKILNIGCGMGREAFLLYDMGFNLVGVDISEEVIAEAGRRAKQTKRDIKFLHTDGKKLPFDNNTFDVLIIWSQTVGLIYGETRQFLFLNECKRVMKANGIISFSGHDYIYIEQNHPDCIEEKKFFPFVNSDIYWEMFTKDQLSGLAVNARFSVIECGTGNTHKPEDGVILHCVARK